MANRRYSCILLSTDDAGPAARVEEHLRGRFDVRHVSRHPRSEKVVPPSVGDLARSGGIDFLFNFLSPMIVPAETLRAFRCDAINVHPAPPEWPGVGGASFAIYHNDATFGVTVHRMSPEIDAGEIVRVDRFPVRSDDSCDTLWDRALAASVVPFLETCDVLARDGWIAGSGERWARRATTRREFERWMHVSPTDSAEEVARKVRAVRHRRFPGPFVELAGFRFELPPRS